MNESELKSKVWNNVRIPGIPLFAMANLREEFHKRAIICRTRIREEPKFEHHDVKWMQKQLSILREFSCPVFVENAHLAAAHTVENAMIARTLLPLPHSDDQTQRDLEQENQLNFPSERWPKDGSLRDMFEATKNRAGKTNKYTVYAEVLDIIADKKFCWSKQSAL